MHFIISRNKNNKIRLVQYDLWNFAIRWFVYFKSQLKYLKIVHAWALVDSRKKVVFKNISLSKIPNFFSQKKVWASCCSMMVVIFIYLNKNLRPSNQQKAKFYCTNRVFLKIPKFLGKLNEVLGPLAIPKMLNTVLHGPCTTYTLLD
jgi:hypothetical protein